MRPVRVLYPVAGLLFAAAALSPLPAQAASPTVSSVSTVAPGTSTPTAPSPGGMTTTSSRLPTRTLRQILPDPALLDGSKLAPDKYPEYGMIGDFEMPGDDVTEPAQNQRVGASNPNQTAPTAGGDGKMDPNQKGGGGSSAQTKSNQAGGGGGAQSQSDSSSGGGGDQSKSAQSNGGSNGGSQSKSGASGGGAAQANAGNSGSGGGASAGGSGKAANSSEVEGMTIPTAIVVGDTTMAIKPVAPAPDATGKATADAGTSGGQAGKGLGPIGGVGGSSGNRGSERGKTIPSGL